MSLNKWVLLHMIIIAVLFFMLGYNTHAYESDHFSNLPDWIAQSSLADFTLAKSESNTDIVTLKDLKEVQQAFEFIQRNFIEDNVTKGQLINGAIAGGIASLGDEYSRFVPPEESNQIQEDIKGFYGGVGIIVESIQNGKGALITSVFKTGPAYEAGLMAGDLIIAVDDEDTTDLFLHEVVAKIKGPQGTFVKMTVFRSAIEDNLDFDVERKEVKYPSVFEKKILENSEGIGYIHLIQFNNESAKDMQEAINELTEQGMQSLILDLRQNTGGSFPSAIEISDLLIDKGIMVYTQDRNKKLTEYKGVDEESKLDIPLVVLVDSYSASASEILAGAIKDYHTGTLIGTKTFGKGVVQNVVTLPGGGTLILTTAKYLTPEHHDIHKKGIQPDIKAEIDFETTSDPFLKEKYEKMEELRDEMIGIRDELMEYLRDYDYQLEVAKQYLETGELLDGASFIAEEKPDETGSNENS